jgi:hypothetical protein
MSSSVAGGPPRPLARGIIHVTYRSPTSSLRARVLGLAASGLIVAGTLLVPATALAGPGSPPDPHPDTITTLEDTPVNGNVLTNDDNPGEGTLTVVAPFPTLSASVGTLTVEPDGDYLFTPAAGFFGSASTTYNVANDKHTRSAAIDIVVTNVQDPPVADDDTISVSEDTPTNVTAEIKANDTDPDGDTLTVTEVSNASGGSVVLAAGVVTFTPDDDLCGSGEGGFDYTISDGNGGSDSASVTVNITCVNDDPHAVNDTASGTEDTDLVIAGADLVANDTDTEDDTLTVSDVSNATGGSATLDSGDVTFTPDADLCGADVAGFTYTVSDGNGGTDNGHVSIDLSCVADAPAANDDTVTVVEDSADTDVTADLLANDTDADGDTLTITDASNATGGSVDLTAGAVTFTPDAGACGDGYGGFDYMVDDGDGNTDSAHATVDVTCVNDDPLATGDTASGTEDTDVVIDAADLVANDSDVDGDTLSVSGVSNPTGGTVDLTAGTITFTPDADLCGDAAAGFDYTVDDGNGGTATGHVTIDLACENDNPVAVSDSLVATEDTDLVVDAADLLANDSDIDGDTLVVSGVSNAVGGTVELDGTTVTFTPDADLCGDGEGGFDYDISDGQGGSASASVVIDITCVNDDPVAIDDGASGTEDTDVVIDAADLAANDTDTEDDGLTVTGVSDPTGGSVSLDAGTITFTPDADLCGTGEAGFDYTVEDGNGGSDTGHVTIDLTCTQDGPDADDDTVMVDENSGANDVTAAILANDSDVDGDTLVVDGVSNPTGGNVDLAAGVVTFTPTDNLCGNGEGGFDYSISDGHGGSDSAHVTVDINCVPNVAPVATDDTASGTEDTDVVIDAADLLANDTDGDDDALSVDSVTNATGGTVDLEPGTVTFTPDADLCGSNVGGFDYTVGDGNGGSDTGHVTISLTCVNDAPVGVDDVATVAQGSGPADYNVVSNDTDAENATLSATAASVSPLGAGTVSIVAGKVRFAPAASFNGAAVITYTVSDGSLTDQATLTVTVTPDTLAPAVTAPVVAFGTGRVDQTAPVRISWMATDTGSGLASYEVQVSIGGAAFQPVYTGLGTAVKRYYPFKQDLVWRVRATDNEGNTSAWVMSATRRIVAYQNSSHVVKYKGTWRNVRAAAASGDGYANTKVVHGKAKLAFTGRSVLYVSTKSKISGFVKVKVDGKVVGTYKLHASKTKYGRIIVAKAWASGGDHRIKIVNVSKNGKRANFDTYVVLK